jgi:hypothetical protein
MLSKILMMNKLQMKQTQAHQVEKTKCFAYHVQEYHLKYLIEIHIYKYFTVPLKVGGSEIYIPFYGMYIHVPRSIHSMTSGTYLE